MSKQIIEKLRILGLTQYEAQVFLELYRRSPQNATSLSKNSAVSRGRIYEVLRSLGQVGLVMENSISGKPNLYELSPFPECLEKLKDKEILSIETAYSDLTEKLELIDREQVDSLEKGEFSVIRGENALNYYIKKLMKEAREQVVTNFTADLMLKYKSSFLELKKRSITCTFVINDQDLKNDQIISIIKGGEIYAIALDDIPNPLMAVFKDVRPTMLIVDDQIGVIIFYKHSQDGLLVSDQSILQYQSFVLKLFIQGAEKKEFD
ncbi:MAG: TrmB family transcriptional regulator [Candidatus Hodarchaeales archaeon]|jgi:sugar-specific transcriptional regulator TrmB